MKGPKIPLERRDHEHQRVREDLEETPQLLLDLPELVAVHAEHRPEDDLQGDGKESFQQGKRLPGGPTCRVAGGHVAHDLRVGAHPFAVERGHQELALAGVRVAVEEAYRAVAHDGPKGLVPLPA